ncbi:MAG: ComEC/Rec2 family competence protein, partial [Candidatus Colwellbacteria bacterium]|nr:ComEC/Rec2 family competence protein [Candidatus Colwellbacteria bacterium]
FAVFSHWVKFFCVPAVIVLFVLLSGGESSAVRAAIMGIILLIGKGIGRPANMRNIIAFAALGMILWNPAIIVSDIGFILSFAAVLGIIYITPAIKRLVKADEEKMGPILRCAIESTSAQIAVTPVILYFFGSVSPVSLPVNLLIVGTVPFATAFSFLAAFLGVISGNVSAIAAIPANAILQYEIKIIDIFASVF